MAADIMNYGGGGLLTIHALVDDGSAYDIVQMNLTDPATTSAHASLIAKAYIEQSVFSVAAEGGKIACTNYDTREVVDDGLKFFSPLTGSGAGSTIPAAITMEHGPQRGGPGAGSGSPLGYWIYYGYLDNSSSPADAVNRWMAWGVGRVDPSSHNRTMKQGNYISDVITINPEKPEYAIAGLSTLVDTAYLAAVALPLAQYQSVNYGYFPKGSA